MTGFFLEKLYHKFFNVSCELYDSLPYKKNKGVDKCTFNDIIYKMYSRLEYYKNLIDKCEDIFLKYYNNYTLILYEIDKLDRSILREESRIPRYGMLMSNIQLLNNYVNN